MVDKNDPLNELFAPLPTLDQIQQEKTEQLEHVQSSITQKQELPQQHKPTLLNTMVEMNKKRKLKSESTKSIKKKKVKIQPLKAPIPDKPLIKQTVSKPENHDKVDEISIQQTSVLNTVEYENEENKQTSIQQTSVLNTLENKVTMDASDWYSPENVKKRNEELKKHEAQLLKQRKSESKKEGRKKRKRKSKRKINKDQLQQEQENLKKQQLLQQLTTENGASIESLLSKIDKETEEFQKQENEKKYQQEQQYFKRKEKSKKKRKPREYKAPICTFYLEGRCAKGIDCPFRHEGEVKKKKEICKFFLVNACMKGDSCVYSHDLSTIPCKYFHLRGRCRDGNQCRFSHNPISEDEKLKLALQEEEKNAPKPQNVEEKLTEEKIEQQLKQLENPFSSNIFVGVQKETVASTIEQSNTSNITQPQTVQYFVPVKKERVQESPLQPISNNFNIIKQEETIMAIENKNLQTAVGNSSAVNSIKKEEDNTVPNFSFGSVFK